MNELYTPPPELVLGTRLNTRVPEEDQKRQRTEVVEILKRLRNQPGVILADEVGMGKTFVALAIAYSVAIRSPRGPAIVMVPPNLVDKWVQDLKTFCELYLENRHPMQCNNATRKSLKDPAVVRYGVARHSVELMKLLDVPASERCHLIFLAKGALGRRQTDKWIRLALVAAALRRHGRGKADRLIAVKKQIHRFLGQLLRAIGEEQAHDWGEKLWQQLLQTDPATWKNTYNQAVRDTQRWVNDDPVPRFVIKALSRFELKNLAKALEQMPIRAQGDKGRLSERLDMVRKALRQAEDDLWKNLLAKARWRSPLLVMDEAHHLKNPGTLLARQLQSPNSEKSLRTGDGALAETFDRMLFLTATPFQLGHHELVRILDRFGDVHWEAHELGARAEFRRKLEDIGKQLNESQRTAISLQREWSRLRPEDSDGDEWWIRLLGGQRKSLTVRQRAVFDAYAEAKRCREAAEKVLRPWIVRHNKGSYWNGTAIPRRRRLDGAAIAGLESSIGLPVPSRQLLPFFLAARGAVRPGQDLLGEALCSSYEAFRFTRQNREAAKDEQDGSQETTIDLSHSDWYLHEFDRALEHCSGAIHPKLNATVKKVVDLWEAGEKVLVFAFYRHTCRALRIHISQEIERRLMLTAKARLSKMGHDSSSKEIERLLERTQRRYFDDVKSPGRRAVDTALNEIIYAHTDLFENAPVSDEQRKTLVEVMRRFLRVTTTLIRCFPLGKLDSISPHDAIAKTLDYADVSGMSWRDKLNDFIDFLFGQCSVSERTLYLAAAQQTQTRGIRVENIEEEGGDLHAGKMTLANVQVAMGETKRDTRARLMRAFNTPFFPDILICSEVMGEGVDLQRFCRHVIHHDLAWNPSTIEQRTGRIDRLGCKAEGRQPIDVYLPYLAGTADERQYWVMSEREQWFRVVMGQEAVARLITPESDSAISLPEVIADQFSFKLDLNTA